MEKKTNDFDDIYNLNEELYKPKEPIVLTEAQKKAIQKKQLLLIILLSFSAIFLIFFSQVKPSFTKTKKKTPVVSEEKSLSLTDQKDGEVNLDDAILLEYINFLELAYHDNSTINLLPVYQSKFKFEDLADELKLFYFVNSNKFNNYLKEEGKDNCLSDHSLNKQEIDKLIKEQLNISLNSEIMIKHKFSFNTNTQSYITYNEEALYLTCAKYEAEPNISFISNKIDKVIKKGNSLIVYQKAYFMNADGAFKDTAFNQSISNNADIDPNLAFEKAKTYSFVFQELDGKYYLYEKK